MKKKLLFLIISSMIVFSGCALTESVSASDEGILEASVEASVTEIEDVTEELPIKEEVVLPKAYYTESELSRQTRISQQCFICEQYIGI